MQPLSVYGTTKAQGEAGIRQHLPRHLIVRTSWVMGTHGGNFLKTMLRLAAERDALSSLLAGGVDRPGLDLAAIGRMFTRLTERHTDRMAELGLES